MSSAACGNEWERAAELLGAVEGELMHDTAGFIHQTLLREQLVRPQLEPETFTELLDRGHQLRLSEVLEESGL